MILNLGCGDKPINGAKNIDFCEGPGVDSVWDLSNGLFMWKDGSVDGIYARHIIEHFQDPSFILRECYRVLKPGGFLDLYLPHSSSISSIGMLEHYRTFSFNGLGNAMDKYIKVHHKLSWWYGETNWKNLPSGSKWIILPLNFIINILINASPALFENLWWAWIGGAREVQWKGIKK